MAQAAANQYKYAGRVWGKRNATVWCPSVRPPVCPVFLTLILRAAHAQRDSPGGSTRRGQRTFPPEYYEDGHTSGSWLTAGT